MVQRTAVFPIFPDERQVEALIETERLYRDAWQHCIDVAWDLEELSAIELHKKVYALLKARLGLKSRLDARTLSFDKPRKIASIATQHGRIKVPLVWHRHAGRFKDWNCKAGEIGINRKGKWVLRLVFEKEVVKPARSEKIIGVDRGIKRAVVSSDNRFIGEREWKEHERKSLSFKSKLQSAGTPSAKRHLKKVSGRLKRFKENCDRIVAKTLLFGLQAGDTIVLES